MSLITKKLPIKLTLNEPIWFKMVMLSPRENILEGKGEHYIFLFYFQLIFLYIHSNLKRRHPLDVSLKCTSNKHPLCILLSRSTLEKNENTLKKHVQHDFFMSCKHFFYLYLLRVMESGYSCNVEFNFTFNMCLLLKFEWTYKGISQKYNKKVVSFLFLQKSISFIIFLFCLLGYVSP